MTTSLEDFDWTTTRRQEHGVWLYQIVSATLLPLLWTP